MSYPSTQHKIIAIARELFAVNSVYKTTMEDIAKAANLGRRTLYTYFKTKDDLYNAVVAAEIELLLNGLRKLVNTTSSPDVKLRRYLFQRFNYINRLIKRNPSIKEDWLFATDRIETLRKQMDKQEVILVEEMLKSGNAANSFRVENPQIVSQLIHNTLKSLEVEFIASDFSKEQYEKVRIFWQVILKGIHV